ncbi:MAG: tetratricopeptide repeat protein [Chloroflexi bacterium]|nr:tetratricopeptide repeat protein [Chloroflexota bacterium]
MAETISPGDTIRAQIGEQSELIAVGKNITQIKNIYQHVPTQPVDATARATAQAKLAALPLDAIPALAPLPIGSRLPLSPNPLFVGREADFRTLAHTLKGDATVAIGPATIAAATGGGGYGKTQLAVEFAHRYGQFFAGGVFWLNFADPAGVPAEIANCGGVGGLDLRPDYANLKLDEQVKLILAAWQSELPRLLIFDNCEDESLLDAWRPPSGACRILLTSRRAEWELHLNVQRLPLALLPRAESIRLLHKFRPDLPESAPDLAAIAEELGDLPLALHLAGSYLKCYQWAITPTAFLAQLRSPTLLQHRALQQGRHAQRSPTQHDHNVARTFALSYDRLDASEPVDALALKLLARTAYFAPGVPIPRPLLLASSGSNQDDPEVALQSEDALHRLVELGLLESEANGALRLHRLLARFLQMVSIDDNAQADVEETMSIFAYNDNMSGYPARLLAWQPHLQHVTDCAQLRNDQRSAKLATSLGYHFKAVGDLVGARPYYEQALTIRRQVLGEEHPDTASSLNNLGNLLQAQGDLTTAKPYYEQALTIRRQVLGEEHPDTARSFNNLGLLLKVQGDLTTARFYYEQALVIYKKVLSEQHPNIAASLNNLGSLLQDQGDLATARAYFEQALAIRQKTLGEQHPDTAQSLRRLGRILWKEGKWALAHPYYEQALAIYMLRLGPNHRKTRTVRHILKKLKTQST